MQNELVGKMQSDVLELGLSLTREETMIRELSCRRPARRGGFHLRGFLLSSPLRGEIKFANCFK